MGFLALGCQAGRLNWSDPGAPCETVGNDVAEPPDAGFAAGGGARPVTMPFVANSLPGSEFVLKLKYHTRAATAYQRCRRSMGRTSNDYQIGFERGYMDLARGGLGRTPAVAPKKYWGPAYRTPEGQTRQQDWLAGYTMGTQMAQEDGLGQAYPVSVNPTVQYYRNDVPSWASGSGY